MAGEVSDNGGGFAFFLERLSLEDQRRNHPNPEVREALDKALRLHNRILAGRRSNLGFVHFLETLRELQL